jgi:hypothetical protein
VVFRSAVKAVSTVIAYALKTPDPGLEFLRLFFEVLKIQFARYQFNTVHPEIFR